LFSTPLETRRGWDGWILSTTVFRAPGAGEWKCDPDGLAIRNPESPIADQSAISNRQISNAPAASAFSRKANAWIRMPR